MLSNVTIIRTNTLTKRTSNPGKDKFQKEIDHQQVPANKKYKNYVKS